ncbi:MAG: hypothetical protein OHK0013_30940 [Sandaracinaceae bacterium]
MPTRRPLASARWLAFVTVLGIAGFADLATAQPLPEADVPPALRPWIPWALDGVASWGCTLRDGTSDNDANPVVGSAEPVCVWPGELTLRLAADGATFAIEATSDRRTALALPGRARHWPREVTVDGRPAVVLAVGEVPTVWLEPGAHRIEGRFVWTVPPDTLAVPDAIARITIVRDGVATQGARGAGGEVWLRGTTSASAGEEQVGLEVHRRIADGSPLELSTRIVVRAAGRARELRLPRVLPEGVVPVEVSADLPVRLLASGELAIQLHAGTFTIAIRALAADPETVFRRPALDAPWPEQEVWVWVPDESFRQVQVEGAAGIDPQRTSLPDEWRGHSAYLVDARTALTLRTLRRGEPTPPPNQLGIQREIWLDLDGDGFTARDLLTIEMHSAHRLELIAGELGRVSLDGQDQLVTRAVEGGRPGLELRDTRRTFTAEWRVESSPSRLPAVNWSENAASVVTTLNVPPGWTLVHASGVDRAPGTWLDRWTLLGVFALLLIAASVGRVFGAGWGVVALAGVGLAFHEEGAPQWLWLVLSALAGLHRALHKRAFERVVRWAYVAVGLVAVVVVVWFVGAQLERALYPQLAPTAQSRREDGLDLSPSRTVAVESEAASASVELWSGDYGRAADEEHGAGSRTRSFESNAYWLDPNAVVQTGFGVPTWSWSRYELAFDGPVARDHEMRLLLLPPWAYRLAAFLRAALLLALLAAIVLRRPRPPAVEPSDGPREEPTAEGAGPSAPVASAAVLALIAGLGVASIGHAQEIPDQATLDALRERLTRPAPCGERCSEANRMAIRVQGDVLRIRIDVSAANPAAYPLPGPSDAWVPSAVTIDGVPTRALVRLDNGFLHARVPAGAHVLLLEGPLTGREAITLAFGRSPRALELEAEGWEASGHVSDDRVAESIQLRRTIERTAGEAEARSELPTWLEVRRRISIGVRWTVETTVARRSPANAPAVARIPLLPGEQVTDSGFVVEDGAVLVTLGQRDAESRWTSVIAPSETLTLVAPAEGATNEVWTLACSPLWHCDAEGLAPTTRGPAGVWEPTFHPWPGESLELRFTRPLAAEGQSVTLDRATLTVRPGVRLTSSTLETSVRSSVSAPLTVEIPAGADVQALLVDGQPRPLQREGDRVSVSLQPGAHTMQLTWQSNEGWTTVLSTPRVVLGSAAVNVDVQIDLSSDRWILWLSGPAWGPAVLFWPYLALVIVIALALSRRREIPLRPHDWVLLLVGLTQVPPVAAIIVVLWFFLLANRRADLRVHDAYFDARQLLIVGYTLVAFGCLVWAVDAGLLGDPEMDVAGPDCTQWHVRFFVDRTVDALPVATVVSLPIWVYRVLMFLWALWLAVSLIRWAKWGWEGFREGGLVRFASGRKPMRTAASVPQPVAIGAPPPVDAASAENVDGGATPRGTDEPGSTS